ncbi:hypothetical protein DSM112329_04422 [Paraconexibacter sp. AEG42_29]|uniref:Serine hydrolase n=1 Tax=Paraconexibacter sp. AEG42_29 TaxID=2997339 RepID=A0AAU7B1N7_9ACTN
MRLSRLSPLVAALTLAGLAAPAADAELLSARDKASFGKLQSKLGGQIGLAVSPLGKGQAVESAGSLKSAIAWSTSKVPVAMAVVAAGRTSAQSSNLRAAITASDNAAAERLWSSLGSGTKAAGAATRQLRSAGDRTTTVQSRRLRSGYTAFGQTVWAVADQARFVAGMPCLKAGRAVLDLMGQTVGGQRWGLGRIDGAAQLKGGWGPGSSPGANGGYIDRQMGIARVGGRRVAIAMISRPADGSHETGTRNMTAIATWAKDHLSVAGVPASPGC